MYKFAAVGVSSMMVASALTPAALAAGTVAASSGKRAVGRSGVKYAGTTSQNKAIKFTRSSGRVSGSINWKGKCTNGDTLTASTAFKNVPLNNGKFAVSGSYNAPINNGQYEGHYTVSIAGTVGATKAHGTFSGKSKVFSGSTLVTTCKSGSVTWTAHKVL
jgi:hypothetical protein